MRDFSQTGLMLSDFTALVGFRRDQFRGLRFRNEIVLPSHAVDDSLQRRVSETIENAVTERRQTA